MACSEKIIRAVGRENLPYKIPVIIAKPINPTIDSMAAIMLAVKPAGLILPYPTVVNVCALKKKASQNLSTKVFPIIQLVN